MLTVKNLGFGYRFRPILRGVNFKVNAGQILHLVGPNGCGKSTTISILAGLIRQSHGEVNLSIEGNVAQDRREFTEYLPAEANGHFEKMDAMQNLRFYSRLRGQHHSDERIIKALESWDLGHPLLRSRFAIQKFSTGMKRRLALARVELSQTPLWLLDEPLYGLDQKGIGQFQNLLTSHLDNGGAIVVVSHDSEPLKMFNPTVHTLNPLGAAS